MIFFHAMTKQSQVAAAICKRIFSQSLYIFTISSMTSNRVRHFIRGGNGLGAPVMILLVQMTLQRNEASHGPRPNQHMR